MKKIAFFLAPLMAISFLTNCGGQSGPKQYIVTFDLNGGTSEAIPAQTVKEGERATKPEKDPTRAEDGQAIYAFNEWQLEGAAFDFATSITSDITLKADWNIAHKYAVNVDETHTNHLSFTTTAGDDLSTIKAIEGKDFEFKMKVKNTSNAPEYLIPSLIDIEINNMPKLISDYYDVIKISDTEARVIIKGSKIIGNIVISGSAALKDHYICRVSAHDGLKEIQSKSVETGKDLTLKFEPIEKYKLPKEENILILFDNATIEQPLQWVSPAEHLSDYCSYNENNGELTIKPNHIKNNIRIMTRANDYPLLEKSSWKKINEYSLAGWAPYIFYIGEEKTVIVNTQPHKVRIIDFNYDYIDPKKPDESKVGITFEFVNVVSEFRGLSDSIPWEQGLDTARNYNFPDSTLNNFLNNDDKSIFKKLPIDLQSAIKAVNKKVDVSTDRGDSYHLTDYTTKLFPLSSDELNKDVDKYQYYIDHPSDNDRIKTNLAGQANLYWLRFPNCDERRHDEAQCVLNDGKIYTQTIWNYAAVAPAFCI